LAVLLAQSGDHTRAVEHFQETIRLDPENDHSLYELGLSQLALKNPESATKSFRETVRINPQHGPAWINLGLNLLQMGQTAEGKEALLRAAEFPDTAADAYYNLAIAASRENDTAAAAQYLQKVIDVAPTHPTAAWDLTRDYLKANRLPDAVAVLRAAEKANPSNVRVLNLLASILATSADDSIRNGTEALRVAKSAAELTQSRNPMILKTLAEAQSEIGDFPSAIATAQQAMTLVPAGKSDELRAELTKALTEYQAGRPIRRSRF
jgi:tetratricopeptide (TPR) repeat protein